MKVQNITDIEGYTSTEQLKLNERGDLVFGTYLVSESAAPVPAGYYSWRY